MADSSKVRLVRCPKCENLLPELPGYSVYQCGGCGAVLRAKKSDPDEVRMSERPDEARDGVVSEKSDIFPAKSEDLPGKSVPGVENGKGLVSNSDGSSGPVADSNGNDSKGPVEKRGVDKNDMNSGELKSRADESESYVEKANGLRSSDGLVKQKEPERGEVDGFERIGRGDPEDVEFRSLSYAGEGTSRYFVNGGMQRSATRTKNQSEMSRCNGDEHIRPSREELLRRLDELKEQLSKACDVNDRHKEKDAMDPRMYGPESSVDSDHTSGFRRFSRQFHALDEHGIRPNYSDDYHELYGPYPALPRSEMSMKNYHSSAQDLSHVPGYENPYGSCLYTRPLPWQISGHNSQHPRSQTHIPAHFLGPEPDPFEPHLYKNPALNQSSCSCYQCYHKHSQLPAQIPSAACRQYPLASSKHVPFHRENYGHFVRQGYDSRISHPPHVGSYDAQHHTRWPSDFNRVGGFSRPQRVVLTNDGRRCRPMAGGAPFVTCHCCFELLELPKKVPMVDKNRWKIRCGGCSSLICFAMVDEKLIPVDATPKQTLMDAFDSSGEVLHDRPYDPHGGMRRDNMGFHSEDYENSGYDFQSMEKEGNSSSDCQGFNSSKSEELQNPNLLSSGTSEDEVYAGNFINGANTMPVKSDSSPPRGSPLEEHYDYSSKYRAVNRCGKGNLSSRSDQERVLPCKNNVRQNSLKDSLATELDISLNDYSNNGVSHDTADTSGEEDLPKARRGVDSFFAGIIKKSFRDFSKSSETAENGKRSVFINGHLIPDGLVKKAEKLAGPISPGQYWYDFTAGFWGVRGGPCLGIIPPHIEEFNFPMPRNCAAGNTGVLVNGRELHQNDLDLLASRGLPVTRDRSYTIEISGEVIDEDSGQELDCLGKLAPTVEKVKHGFGMRVPKSAS